MGTISFFRGVCFLSGSAGGFSAGNATAISAGASTVTATVGTATGGTSPYTYQWYRSTTSGFTPGAGNIVSGATSQTLNDTGLTASTTYYYINIAKDSFGNASVSNQASVTTASASVSGAYQFNFSVNSSIYTEAF